MQDGAHFGSILEKECGSQGQIALSCGRHVHMLPTGQSPEFWLTGNGDVPHEVSKHLMGNVRISPSCLFVHYRLLREWNGFTGARRC